MSFAQYQFQYQNVPFAFLSRGVHFWWSLAQYQLICTATSVSIGFPISRASCEKWPLLSIYGPACFGPVGLHLVFSELHVRCKHWNGMGFHHWFLYELGFPSVVYNQDFSAKQHAPLPSRLSCHCRTIHRLLYCEVRLLQQKQVCRGLWWLWLWPPLPERAEVWAQQL